MIVVMSGQVKLWTTLPLVLNQSGQFCLVLRLIFLYLRRMGILSAQLSKSRLSPSQFENIAGVVCSRILSVCSVERIYIFGSYARGTPTESSDLDIAVLFEDREQLKRSKKIILNSKLFLDHPVDFLFYSIDDFNKKAQIGGVCAVIQNEGKVVYDKRTKV